MLMFNKDFELSELDYLIINRYNDIDAKKGIIFNFNTDTDGKLNDSYIYKSIRDSILEVHNDLQYVTDVLIKYLYIEKPSDKKTTLWSCFGDVIVSNLKNNLDVDTMVCERCGTRTEKKSNRAKYCDECAREVNLENMRRINKERYNSKI